jgi:hypothetical protein
MVCARQRYLLHYVTESVDIWQLCRERAKCMSLKDKFDVFQTEEFGKHIFIAQLPNVVIFMYRHPELKGTGFKNGTGCLRKIVLVGMVKCRELLCVR